MAYNLRNRHFLKLLDFSGQEIREFLAERGDLDAVLIATGPNWHCTASVYTARAGKDMYGEKPLSLTVRQGRVPWISLVLAFSFAFYGLLRKTVNADAVIGLTFETAALASSTAAWISPSPAGWQRTSIPVCAPASR